MHRSESAQLATCIDCGADVWPERDRAYLISSDDVLCYGCAQRRGGEYDELHDHWVRPPNLSGITLPSP